MKNPLVQKFNGLNNVADPLRLDLDWLTVADNVEITKTGALRRRDGYALSLAATAIAGAYSTSDLRSTYLVDAGVLKRLHDDMSLVTLRTGLSDGPVNWSEVNNHVYFTNGVDTGIILQDDAVIDWSWTTPGTPDLAAVNGDLPAGQYQVACTYVLADGRETGAGMSAAIDIAEGESLQINNIPQVTGCTTMVYIAPANSDVFQFAFSTALSAGSWNASPDSLGAELTTQFLSSVPDCSHVAIWRGRAYVMRYLPELDITAIWASQPLGFHLFNLQQDFIPVPGEGLLLTATNEALIIGTEQAIHAWNGESLATLANYGVVPGWCSALDDKDGQVWIWTQRGLCSVLPFVNQTYQQISVAPGAQAGAAIVRKNGETQFIVALQAGGVAFNPRR